MKTPHLLNHYTLATAMMCLSLANIQVSNAAAINLTDSPLYLLTSAKPNIFFLVDDSWSMDEELATNSTEAASNVGYVFKMDGETYSYVFDDALSDNRNGDSDVVPPPILINYVYGATTQPASLDKAWMARSSAYNKLYYNPGTTYKAWPGYPDANDTTNYPNYEQAAYRNPGNTAQGTVNLTSNYAITANISGTNYTNPLTVVTSGPGADPNAAYFTPYYPASYYVFNDLDNDGIIDAGEESHKLIEIKSTTSVCAQGTNATIKQQYDGSCMRRSYNDEIRNFANYFSYYRKRLLAAKSAISLTVNDPFALTTRMGFATINNNYSNRRLTVNDLSIPSQKSDFMSRLLQNVTVDGTTPLHDSLNKAGKYYQCNISSSQFSGDTGVVCPIQGMASNGTGTAGSAGECQQNFTILVTDGEYNDTAIGSDTDDDVTTTMPSSNPSPFDGNPYHGSTAGSLADIAMTYYKDDFSKGTGGLSNKVPTKCGVDENNGQHMVFYGITFGIQGTLNWSSLDPRPFDTHACDSSLPASDPFIRQASVASYAWPSPTNEATRVDDLMHAAYNGRGHFLASQSPDELITNLKETLSDIASRKGAAAAVGLSSTSNTNGTRVYLSTYNSGTWFGELSAYDITNLSSPIWNASTELDSNSLTTVNNPDRSIVTYNPISGGTEFIWANLTADQQADLNAIATATDTNGQYRLNYVRGDHSCETGSTAACGASGKIFRLRKKTQTAPTRVGDFVNSAPVYVGAPIGNYPDAAPFPTTSTYSVFKNAQASRTPMVYIGGNDGMLHAFSDANNGKEVFAYVPNALSETGSGGAGLHNLTEAGQHRSYVDLTPAIADAYIATPADPTVNWRTILVGGLRNGGKGIYALDVTDPAAIIADTSTPETTAATKVMWEFTAARREAPPVVDPDMGYTYSQPIIVPLKTSASTIDWFAIFGNGYNSTNGHAVLYIVKLSGPGTNKHWQTSLGEYYKIDTGVGTALSSGTPNGLSSPAVIDSNSDGIYDRVYAGDLYGNMWTFDLSSSTPSDWTNSTAFSKLFAAGSTQSITAKPTVIRNTTATSANEPINFLVLFGTGSYIADGDQITNATQSFYGIWDDGTGTKLKTDLVQQTLTTTSHTFLNNAVAQTRKLTTAAVPYSTKSGWYINFDAYERIVTKATILGGSLLFPTIIPTSGSCGGGGTSWLMAVNPYTGTAPGIPTFDANGDGVISSADNLGASTAVNNQNNLGDIVVGTQQPTMTPEFAFVSVPPPANPPTNPPCPSGSAQIQGIGTATDANTSTTNLCVPGGSGKSGRYSWRQLHF